MIPGNFMQDNSFMDPDYNRTKRFPITSTGYQEAAEFLKATDRLHLLEKEQSTDGYTLVALANSLYAKDQLTDLEVKTCST